MIPAFSTVRVHLQEPSEESVDCCLYGWQWVKSRLAVAAVSSVDIKIARYKGIHSLVRNDMRQEGSESARELRIALYKSDQ